jgi:hypothetical protein
MNFRSDTAKIFYSLSALRTLEHRAACLKVGESQYGRGRKGRVSNAVGTVTDGSRVR